MRVTENSMKVSRPFSRVYTQPGGWLNGTVITPNGIVEVYAQGGANEQKHTRLDFVWGGRLFIRGMPGVRLTKRGLVTAARRFAEQITEEQQ